MSWAACQVQSAFSVSCVSQVTMSRVVQAVGHGFVIFRHSSAAPSGAGWVQVGAGDPWAGWPGEGCGEWGFWGSPGTDLPMSPWLFSCVGGKSIPSLSQRYHLTLVLQGHQPGSLGPGPRVLTFPSARSPAKPGHGRGVPRHFCPEPPSPAFGLAQGPGSRPRAHHPARAQLCPSWVSPPLPGLGVAAAPHSGLCEDKGSLHTWRGQHRTAPPSKGGGNIHAPPVSPSVTPVSP